MIEIVWEVLVKEEARGLFELAYGPGGAWGKLCGRCPGFRGTTLLRDTQNPRRYLVIELWDTLAKREEMLGEREDEYAALQAVFAGWTESMNEVGAFKTMAEATVRPRGKRRRGRAGGDRRARR